MNTPKQKSVKSKFGEFELDIPIDRKGYKPTIVPKSKRDISGAKGKIVSLYSRRMSTRDIHDQTIEYLNKIKTD